MEETVRGLLDAGAEEGFVTIVIRATWLPGTDSPTLLIDTDADQQVAARMCADAAQRLFE